MNRSSEFIELVLSVCHKEEESDVTLIVGPQKYYAHKFIMTLHGDVFKTMLQDNNWKDSTMPEIQLEESEECQAVFSDFLKFLYTGCLEDMTVDKAFPLLVLADKYNIKMLQNGIEQFMIDSITLNANFDYIITWYQYINILSFPKVQSTCLKFIELNIGMSSIMESDDWLNLSLDSLISFLANPNLVVKNEFQLFKGVERWLIGSKLGMELSQVLDQVLALMAFDAMTDEDLRVVSKSELAKSYKDQFTPYIYKAFLAHEGGKLPQKIKRIYLNYPYPLTINSKQIASIDETYQMKVDENSISFTKTDYTSCSSFTYGTSRSVAGSRGTSFFIPAPCKSLGANTSQHTLNIVFLESDLLFGLPQSGQLVPSIGEFTGVVHVLLSHSHNKIFFKSKKFELDFQSTNKEKKKIHIVDYWEENKDQYIGVFATVLVSVLKKQIEVVPVVVQILPTT